MAVSEFLGWDPERSQHWDRGDSGVWFCPVVGERMGRDNWKYVCEILAADMFFRLLNITMERPSCILHIPETLSLCPC